jgi:hypothetical protein
MRTLIAGLIATGLAFSQASAPPRAENTLDGRVVTGAGPEMRPVRRAKVTLMGGGLRAPVVSDSGTTGAFRFDHLPAGPFRIAVERPGFVKLNADATPNVTLTLERGGAIEGIVADVAGDPVMNVLVSALLAAPGGGKPTAAAQTRTDDLGHYRLHSLAAGDYYVEAASDRLSTPSPRPGEKVSDFNKGYYPASSALEDARTIRVLPGRDVNGIDVTFSPARPVRDPAIAVPPRPDRGGNGRISGVLTDASSGKPIRDAEVLLLPAPGQGQRLTDWHRTDGKGHFEYTGLPSQRYVLTFQAKGYIGLEYGEKRPGETGTQIRLGDGQDLIADMKLPRTSAIEGTVLDEFGDPAPNISVRIGRKQYAAGRQRLTSDPSSPSGVSDDRGQFRIIGFPPGDYYVVAFSGVYTDANEVGGFAPTFYPGTADAAAGVPVTVSIGTDLTGLTFALAAARTVSVSGTMLDPDGKAVSGRGTVWLVTPDHLKRLEYYAVRAATNPDGTFVLRNVPQGQYTLQGFAPPAAGYTGPFNLSAFPFGWTPLAVGDSNVDGVNLKTSNGTTLAGKIVLDDDGAPPPEADAIYVNAIPTDFDSSFAGGGPSPSERHADLTFAVTRLTGTRRILASSSSPQWAVKKITVHGVDVTDSPVDFQKKDVDDAEIVLTSKVTQVNSTVSGPDGAVLDYALVIFASDPTKWFDRSRYVVTARPTQDGHAETRGLPPDEYLAIALPSLQGTEWMDPDFLQQLRASATSFSLLEGESKTLTLRLQQRPR